MIESQCDMLRTMIKDDERKIKKEPHRRPMELPSRNIKIEISTFDKECDVMRVTQMSEL